MAVFTMIAAAITSAFFAVAGAMGATLATAGLALAGTIVGYVGAAVIYGGVALALSSVAGKMGKSGRAGSYGDSSATYGNPVLQTQTNQDLPIPLLYGTVKLAGNRIWQDDDVNKNIKRIVGFAEGEITDFSDVRLNDIKQSDIKGITVNKYLGTPGQIVDPIVGGKDQAERVKKVGSLKNVAYLAVNVPKGEKIDANYNLTTVVKGRKIRIYTTPTSYTTQYSENPAWVMLDFLISYNGLGLCLNNDGTINDNAIAQLFDMYSFIESAAYCDEEVTYTDSDGILQKSPRFTFNMIFDSQASARDLLDEIYRSCRGGLFTKNGKLQFKIDKAQPVSKVFTAEDIVKGSETFGTIPTEEHYDILKVVYISPAHEWQKVEAYAEIPQYRDGVPIEHAINCYSVTNFQQASRLAWYYVNSKILCPYFGSFKTDYRAYDLEVGDVIQIDSLLMGLEKYLVKVTSVVDDGAGTFTVNWRTYDERLYDDTLGGKEPRVLVSILSDTYGSPDDVLAFNVVQNQKLVEFAWTAVEGTGITYEIRRGESWATSKVIASNLTDTTYTTNLTAKGVLKYWIKAKNLYNYSKNATSDILNVQYIPELNEIVSCNIFENLLGEFENTKFYRGKLKLKSAMKWQKISDFWQKDGGRYYSDTNNKWATQTVTVGSYTSQIFDVGASLNNIVSFDYILYSTDPAQNITIEWRYSEDGIEWSEWIIGATGAYQFRYYQVRVILNNPNGAMMWLSDFVMAIDVPDRKEEYTNRLIENAEDGITIIYAEDPESIEKAPFIKETPHVLVTPYATNAYPNVIESKRDFCVIKLYKNDGTETTGAVNITVSGY